MYGVFTTEDPPTKCGVLFDLELSFLLFEGGIPLTGQEKAI
ncbi:MAG: hypothetical protein QCI82_10750 [Candidatus Thermoplasmatota archaeon]|nr:hypothetical protein [Candidatus Thermoplasmatota archaeon]